METSIAVKKQAAHTLKQANNFFPLVFIKAVRINKYSKDSVCSTALDMQKQMISMRENY